MAALPSLRQLSYLVTLSETLHFTEAARRSFVTQSTLSGGIMELERLLGGVLVERDRQNVRLTPLGEQVVARARVLLADAQDLMRLSREMSEPLTGDLHLGIIPTIAPFILTQLLEEVHKQLPKFSCICTKHKVKKLLNVLNTAIWTWWCWHYRSIRVDSKLSILPKKTCSWSATNTISMHLRRSLSMTSIYHV